MVRAFTIRQLIEANERREQTERQPGKSAGKLTPRERQAWEALRKLGTADRFALAKAMGLSPTGWIQLLLERLVMKGCVVRTWRGGNIPAAFTAVEELR